MLQQHSQLRPFATSMLAVALFAMTAHAAFADDAKETKKTEHKKATPRYIIGVSASNRSMGALRSQMPELKDQGLLVYYVGKKTPAEKAGLKRYDILLSANGKALKTLRDLSAVTNAAGKESKAVSIGFLRGGKNQKADVTPMLLSEAIKNYKKSSSSSKHKRHHSSKHKHSSYRSSKYRHHGSSSYSQLSKQIQALTAAVEKLNKKLDEK